MYFFNVGLYNYYKANFHSTPHSSALVLYRYSLMTALPEFTSTFHRWPFSVLTDTNHHLTLEIVIHLTCIMSFRYQFSKIFRDASFLIHSFLSFFFFDARHSYLYFPSRNSGLPYRTILSVSMSQSSSLIYSKNDCPYRPANIAPILF